MGNEQGKQSKDKHHHHATQSSNTSGAPAPSYVQSTAAAPQQATPAYLNQQTASTSQSRQQQPGADLTSSVNKLNLHDGSAVSQSLQAQSNAQQQQPATSNSSSAMAIDTNGTSNAQHQQAPHQGGSALSGYSVNDGNQQESAEAAFARQRSPTSRRIVEPNGNSSNNSELSEADFMALTSKYKKLTVDDFELLKVIGKGSFGKVMQVRKKSNGKIYAMKVLKKDVLVKRRQILHTKTERKILEDVNNPFIVGLRYAFQTEGKLYLVMDYFAGGELFFHLKQSGRFSEERAKFYAAELIVGLECLHKQQIVYRDLKPENVLLDHEGHIRLTDFGLAKDGVANWDRPELAAAPTRTFCGTPEYLAPEMIARLPYGLAVDWWALGTLLFEMLSGLPPFYDGNLHVMYEKIVRGKLHMPAYLSPSCQQLLYGLLERDPKRRLGYVNDGEELRNHPWFASINWQALHDKKIPAPFKPKNVGGELDTQNVDDEFKRLPAADTPSGSLRTKIDFEGFTYAPAGSQMTGAGTTNHLSSAMSPGNQMRPQR